MPPECSLSLSSILVRARCNHRATAAADNPAAFTELPRVTMLENEERIRVLFANPPGLLAELLPQGYSDGTRSHATNHRSPLLLFFTSGRLLLLYILRSFPSVEKIKKYSRQKERCMGFSQ